VDNNPVLRGKTMAGAPIIGPNEIGAQERLGASEPIVIATLLHTGEIGAQIRRLGLSNPVLTLLENPNVKSIGS
jgi:hypothetical protein